MRPAQVTPEEVGGGHMGGVFVAEANATWDEYDKRGDRGILFAWLWSTMIMQQKLIFKLFKHVAEIKAGK